MNDALHVYLLVDRSVLLLGERVLWSVLCQTSTISYYSLHKSIYSVRTLFTQRLQSADSNLYTKQIYINWANVIVKGVKGTFLYAHLRNRYLKGCGAESPTKNN